MNNFTLGMDNNISSDASANNEKKDFSYITDRFSKEALINIIRTSGYNASILNEEYFKALEERKSR